MLPESSGAQARTHISLAGMIIGCIGCVIITASSVYTALKMGSLPWPTIFTSIMSLVLLRACGRRSLNEVNVTQIIMSAGSMVAGGIAFTIPGIWMLGLADTVSPLQIMGVALAGTLLGLVCTALIRRRFVDESDLEYPIGTAAAETLLASEAGGNTGRRLFVSMGLAGVYAAVRDVAHLLPPMIATLPIPGVAFAIYNSPMMLGVGFLIGASAVGFQLAGGLLANFGLIWGGSTLGLVDLTTAQGMVASAGMGLMMGSGLGVVIKDILPKLAIQVRAHTKTQEGLVGDLTGRYDAGALALMVALAVLIVVTILRLSPIVAVVVIAMSFVTTIMSAQSVGQTGIDPMEIFGLIVLLLVAWISDTASTGLFLVAALIAVTCGLAGDVMSDFKTGAVIGTDPRSMWYGQAIGALLGSVIAVITLCALFAAYGPEAFGPGKLFVSAQASVVATMVSGIPSVPFFVGGILGGILLHVLGLPAIMFGLGVYLPFFFTLTMFVGASAKFIYDRVMVSRGKARRESDEAGIVFASGLLGGESIVGVLIALSSVIAGLLA
ncbi:OPT/YSL family transporter [Collinsella sp. AGMB00827]|uniref:OPT/YSL family transporter n=1 Tax=Collinsella ureilytica TaxID=2869515 RepID=A0ABS7MHK4_9ACTN|nr:OPT/YSL family transporter [Collinsella urealyticum]MBY4796839.1 OPT/YSL family transporter [Collinsella urealyticum]